ncbi:cyclase family protein [Paramicrobacterium chengjingii]|uniref:Cyclase family protein n=1 Tax=Paramicrobacterium chengjingii TaxID=2769067 RepID=A0ABX6YIK9_9MICO|nr:cyclase family protein [Microbacterium chengjingii]QPZ38236.1 cyclase family protein [Microbacterium chengjingii]
MNQTGGAQLPEYRQLGQNGSPDESSWGVFGEADEVGTLNLLSPDRVRDAAAAVTQGKVFSLNWNLELPGPAILGRGSPQHEVIVQDAGLDDRYTMLYPQASSQWDSLAHVKHPLHGHYNGFAHDDVSGASDTRLGIHNWARRGIAGRFVLADIARYREVHGDELDCSQRTPVTVAEIDDVLDWQRVKLRIGDILLLHFGWTQWYEGLSPDARQAMGDGEQFACPGLANERASAEWLWDRHVSAIVADCPAVEAMPFYTGDADGFLHYRLIPLLGMALGEMFDLAALAEDCATDEIYEGLFTAAPLHKVGGIGSPANALALK